MWLPLLLQAHRHATFGNRLVSRQTMISVFRLGHQGTGTMEEHKCVYASGAHKLVFRYMSPRVVLFYSSCRLAVVQPSLSASLYQTHPESLCAVHTQTWADKSTIVCRAGMRHVVPHFWTLTWSRCLVQNVIFHIIIWFIHTYAFFVFVFTFKHLQF